MSDSGLPTSEASTRTFSGSARLPIEDQSPCCSQSQCGTRCDFVNGSILLGILHACCGEPPAIFLQWDNPSRIRNAVHHQGVEGLEARCLACEQVRRKLAVTQHRVADLCSGVVIETEPG